MKRLQTVSALIVFSAGGFALDGMTLAHTISSTAASALAFGDEASSSSLEAVQALNTFSQARSEARATGSNEEVEMLQLNLRHENLSGFTPDSSQVIVMSRDNNSMEHIGACLFALPSGDYQGILEHAGDITCRAFSSDGTYLVTGAYDGSVKLWKTKDCTLLKTLKQDKPVLSVDVSHDGKFILTTLWKVTDPLPEMIYRHYNVVTSVSFSPTQNQVLSGSKDHTVKLWNLMTGALTGTFDFGEPVKCCCMSRDGLKVLAEGYTRKIRLWDVTSGTLLLQAHLINSNLMSLVSFHPGEIAYILTDSVESRCEACLVNAGNGTRIRTLSHDAPIQAAVFSRNGKYVLTGSKDGIAMLWSTATGTCIATFKQLKPITAVAINGDVSQILTGSQDGTATQWDVASQKLIKTFGSSQLFDPVLVVDFNANGTRALVESASSFALWKISPYDQPSLGLLELLVAGVRGADTGSSYLDTSYLPI